MSLYQWVGSNNADLGNGGNWVDTTEPGMGQPPGTNDVAIIQNGQGLYGTLNVAGLDIVSYSATTSISITGTGTAEIQRGAKLQLTSSVVSGQSITFESGANTLSLGDAAGFGGHLLDFATGDAIDLLGSVANTLSFSGGALIVDEGKTRIAKIFMTGSYKTANFKLASDNHGGSLISYEASAARPIGEPFSPMPIAHFLG